MKNAPDFEIYIFLRDIQERRDLSNSELIAETLAALIRIKPPLKPAERE